MEDRQTILEVIHMDKNFGVTVALNDISFSLERGNVYGLIGENGSGKSTVSSIIAGMQAATKGDMIYDGKPWKPTSMLEAQKHGIGMIVQEAGTISNITVAENIFLGHEKMFKKGIFIDRMKLTASAQELLDELGITEFKASDRVNMLDMQMRKIIEIAKCMYWKPKILIVDETSTALSLEGREFLYKIMARQRAENKTVLFISHDLDEMMAELHDLIGKEFVHKPWRKFVQGVFRDAELAAAFRVCPAAKSVHHAYVGGLLEHSLGVFKLCRRLADQYAELDRQTLLAGAIFHDIGKIREFSGGLVNDYTDEGRLIGHLELGIEMLAPFWQKAGLEEGLVRHLKHLILSHHGEPAFGAVRLPQTAEALVLHYADNIDAKMAQCRGLFAALEAEEGWTPYQATLSRALFRGPRTPQGSPTEKEPRKSRQRPADDNLLSLL